MESAVLERIEANNEKLNRFMVENNIDPLSYKWSDYIEPFLESRNIRVIKNVPRSSLNFYSGFTVKSKYSTAIFVNPNMVKGRQNFSVVHETDHIDYDFVDSQPTQRFFSVEGNPAFYSEDEYQLEILANTGAGIKMLPDITLVRYMETNFSFPLMAEKLGMTKAALYTRLVQFCETTLGATPSHAISLVRQLQSTGSREWINRRMTTYGSMIKSDIIQKFEYSK